MDRTPNHIGTVALTAAVRHPDGRVAIRYPSSPTADVPSSDAFIVVAGARDAEESPLVKLRKRTVGTTHHEWAPSPEADPEFTWTFDDWMGGVRG